MFKLKKLLLLIYFTPILLIAAEEYEVPILPDDPTEEQMQLVRDGAWRFCGEIKNEDDLAQCVNDYYEQHNLNEEPSCD